MKNFFFFFLLLLLTIPSIYAQSRSASATPADHTAIRSVVAQGGELRILLHVAEAGTYQVNIYSLDGEMVWQQTFQVETGEVEQKIPFGGRPHGVYELSLVGAGAQSSRKVIW
jgi:hypothetical protein